MSLNIKNERVHEMAREAARRTGKSQTSVIEEALARLLRELDKGEPEGERVQRLLAIADDFRARLTDADRERMTTDWLYDDQTGLPK